MAFRSRIILALVDGKHNKEVAEALDTSEQTVGLWRKRFTEEGMEGLRERPRSGRPASIDATIKDMIVTGAVSGKQRTSCRKMAAAAGISKATVQRLWAANDIKPHRARAILNQQK